MADPVSRNMLQCVVYKTCMVVFGRSDWRHIRFKMDYSLSTVSKIIRQRQLQKFYRTKLKLAVGMQTWEYYFPKTKKTEDHLNILSYLPLNKQNKGSLPLAFRPREWILLIGQRSRQELARNSCQIK